MKANWFDVRILLGIALGWCVLVTVGDATAENVRTRGTRSSPQIHIGWEDGTTPPRANPSDTVRLARVAPVAPGNQVCVPIRTTSLRDSGVVAFQAVIRWDPTALEVVGTGFSRAGSLISGWADQTDTSIPGRLAIAAYGTSALADSGSLGCITFRYRGPSGSWSVLSFESFRFNEGRPEVVALNGRIEATAGTGCIPVSLPIIVTTQQVPVRVPVTVGSSVTGRGIYSFQGQFSWNRDTAVVHMSQPPALSAGGVTPPGWSFEYDASVPGKLSVAGYGSTPLEGSGELLAFHVWIPKPGGITTLQFDHTLRFNEGTPCTQATDGILPTRQMLWGEVKRLFRD